MVDFGGPGKAPNRFVCPNDRQLALRAKLKTGWSIKTATLAGTSSSAPLRPSTTTTTSINQAPLDAAEQAAIYQVIKRAEELDQSEQERVGRLIERLDNMRKNALGRNPQQCLLCGDAFRRLLAAAHKIVCHDCRRLICHKCAILDHTVGVARPPQLWLCLLCAETREIWKKSGAWFFKSIPKYVLPADKKGAPRRNSTSGVSRQLNDDSSSDDDRWGRRRTASVESSPVEIDDSSSDDDRWGRRRTASVESSPDVRDSVEEGGVKSLLLPNFESMNRASSVPLADEATDDGEDSRRESSVSRSSEWNWGAEGQANVKASPSVSSTNSSFFRMPLLDEPRGGEALGTIELALAYNPETATLHCTVLRAKNLIPMDINGLSDPFCKLNILPNAKMSARLRTKTVHKTRNPEFNENLTFYDVGDADLAQKALHVLVVDDDRFGHDFMGETQIGLTKLRQQATVHVKAALEQLQSEVKGPLPSPELNQWFDDLWSRGQILLSLCYSTKKRALLVTVCRCANLLPMDNNGFSDPFVKLQLKPDPCHRKHKTSIKWKNLNPIFNEEFAFETRPTELSTQCLYITVFDKDYGKSNDYLGGLVLGGAGSKGLRLKQWLDMIRYPDHRHEAWHNLTEETLD